jgi:hypothetical protein
VLSIIFIPMIFAPVKWYYVAVAYLITPLFALPNSYGCGLTDWDCSSMYAKLALFIFAAWAGVEVGHVMQLQTCTVLHGLIVAALGLHLADQTGDTHCMCRAWDTASNSTGRPLSLEVIHTHMLQP